MNAREAETALDQDPASTANDAQLHFIGRVRSPWKDRAVCPKNMNAARELDSGGSAVEIDEAFRPGLQRLEAYSHIIVLTWFDRADRNLIVQKPAHAPETRGVFALRSPVRPNPIGLHVVQLLALDPITGTLMLDAIDALDGTPVLDIKPYFASVDAFPDATRP